MGLETVVGRLLTVGARVSALMVFAPFFGSMTIAPRIIPDSKLGQHVVAGYSRYLGLTAAEFVKGMAEPPSSCNVASAVIELVLSPDRSLGDLFLVSGRGLEAVT